MSWVGREGGRPDSYGPESSWEGVGERLRGGRAQNQAPERWWSFLAQGAGGGQTRVWKPGCSPTSHPAVSQESEGRSPVRGSSSFSGEVSHFLQLASHWASQHSESSAVHGGAGGPGWRPVPGPPPASCVLPPPSQRCREALSCESVVGT